MDEKFEVAEVELQVKVTASTFLSREQKASG